MKVSIAVPVHDPDGKYSAHLRELIESAHSQSEPPLEVVLTANHQLPYLHELECAAGERFKVIFKLVDVSGAAANTNQAVGLCTGDVVKIMYQDDYFFDVGALSLVANLLEEGHSRWVALGCIHRFEDQDSYTRVMVPRYSMGLLWGKNTIGAPSVVAFRRESFVPFDEAMVFMFDCDWYFRMNQSFGRPLTVDSTQIAIRIHSGQATHWARKKLKSERIRTLKKSLISLTRKPGL